MQWLKRKGGQLARAKAAAARARGVPGSFMPATSLGISGHPAKSSRGARSNNAPGCFKNLRRCMGCDCKGWTAVKDGQGQIASGKLARSDCQPEAVIP